jgi:hypothetical protein
VKNLTIFTLDKKTDDFNEINNNDADDNEDEDDLRNNKKWRIAQFWKKREGSMSSTSSTLNSIKSEFFKKFKSEKFLNLACNLNIIVLAGLWSFITGFFNNFNN